MVMGAQSCIGTQTLMIDTDHKQQFHIDHTRNSRRGARAPFRGPTIFNPESVLIQVVSWGVRPRQYSVWSQSGGFLGRQKKCLEIRQPPDVGSTLGGRPLLVTSAPLPLRPRTLPRKGS